MIVARTPMQAFHSNVQKRQNLATTKKYPQRFNSKISVYVVSYAMSSLKIYDYLISVYNTTRREKKCIRMHTALVTVLLFQLKFLFANQAIGNRTIITWDNFSWWSYWSSGLSNHRILCIRLPSSLLCIIGFLQASALATCISLSLKYYYFRFCHFYLIFSNHINIGLYLRGWLWFYVHLQCMRNVFAHTHTPHRV